jgi:lysophospholipase L1-like esterase
MAPPAWIAVPSQLVLIGCATVMAIWVRAPWVSVAGLGLVGGALMVSRLARRDGTTAVWAFSALIWASFATTNIWDVYFAIDSGFVAAALLLSGPARQTAVATAWSFVAASICVGAGYAQNAQGQFYFGLLGAVALLIFLRAKFRVSALGVQLVNTLLLVLVALPAADFFLRPSNRLDLRPETWRKYYSYDGARGNTAAFALWWQYFQDETDIAYKEIFEPIPGAHPGSRLRPNSRALLFLCPVSINSKGFRGREIPPVKGDAYRIVALGESTTFGMTMAPDDKPWPDLLEQMIRERLKPSRPVEVINAGVPSYSLCDNLPRLPREIAPLQPDMIISYHGVNGFNLVNTALPQPNGPPPPQYRARPLKLLADFEYRSKMYSFRRGYAGKLVSRRPAPLKPLDTLYAACYRQLIEFSKTNGIHLVLANFPMAVNNRSDTRVIEFYRSVFETIYDQIQANEIHSAIVAQLAAQCPEVCLIDAHAHLDGEHQKFIDLIHLTQEGRRQLAENVFTGIREVLEEDLKRERPQNRLVEQ